MIRSIAAFVFILFMVAPALAQPPKDRFLDIQEVISPGGIKAWLVEDHNVPVISVEFAFAGAGAARDPDGKSGLAQLLSNTLDEGAGDLDASAFQERLEEIAMRMSFEDGKDAFYGSVQMLSANREKSRELLKFSLNKARVDTDAVGRIRKQLLANLAYAARDPSRVASQDWYKIAFPNHPYGRPANGTAESLASITRDDLEAYRKRVFARSNLKVVAVGDIGEATLATLLDDVFGALPATDGLVPITPTKLPEKGRQIVVEMPVPQSVAVFGAGAMARKDPDFIPAFVLNHILGGGGFASKLMEEGREKRGLAYSVYSYLHPMRSAAVFMGSVATKNESIAQSLDVIRGELQRMATEGPSATDLDNAKKYLIGSFALRFDTNAKIPSQLLSFLQEDLGIDYVDKRNALIEAVTLDDVKRVAKALLHPDNLLVTVVGQPTNLAKGG